MWRVATRWHSSKRFVVPKPTVFSFPKRRNISQVHSSSTRYWSRKKKDIQFSKKQKKNNVHFDEFFFLGIAPPPKKICIRQFDGIHHRIGRFHPISPACCLSLSPYLSSFLFFFFFSLAIFLNTFHALNSSRRTLPKRTDTVRFFLNEMLRQC